MAQLIQPGSVKIVTKDGEITVSVQIDLNINLHQIGNSIVDGVINVKESINTQDNKQEDAAWIIPDFKPTEKIKFGR